MELVAAGVADSGMDSLPQPWIGEAAYNEHG